MTAPREEVSTHIVHWEKPGKSLENGSLLLGLLKAKNISFEKNVFNIETPQDKK